MKNTSYNNIISHLESVSRRYILFSIIEAFCVAVAVWCSLLFALGFFESLLFLSPTVKALLFYSTIGILSSVFILLLAIRIIRRPGMDDISRMIELTYPHLKNRLISAVQLGRLKNGELRGQSKNLVDFFIVKVEKEIRDIDLLRSVPSGKLAFSVRWVFGSITGILLLSILFPGFIGSGLYRLFDYSHAYTHTGNVTIYSLKGDSSIVRGENFSTPGFISGRRFKPLTVLYRWDDSNAWNVKPIEVDRKTGNFIMSVEKPRISFEYYLESGSSLTSRYRVTVIERPVVEKIELTLTYPDYTGRGSVSPGNNDGNIRVLEGTEVAMIIRANKRLNDMVIQWSDSTETHCTVAGDTGKASFTVTKTVDYHISLIDTLKITNSNPIKYRITSLVDGNPMISIMSPVSEVLLPLSMTFPLIYQGSDDYGLTSVALRFELPHEGSSREIVLKRGALGENIEDSYVWNMAGLSLLPDDVVNYWLIIYDNDTINGPKQGMSDKMTVRVPSITDLLSDVVDEQNEGIEKLRDISTLTDQEKALLDEVKRNIISGNELEWSDRNALAETKKKMEGAQQELKKLSEAINELAEKLSEKDMVAIETLEQYKQITKMMDEIAEGELKEALKQLTQATVELDPHKIKQALDTYKITTEDLKKKLDRIIALLEQVKSIQRYETAKRLVEEIAFKQAELTEKFRNNPEDTELSREESKLASEMQTLQEELRNMVQELSERFELNTDTFQEFLQSADISEKMNEASRNMADGLKYRAEKSLDDSNTMLSELLEKMDDLGSVMKDSNIEEMKRRLFTALMELLAVSKKQEEILDAFKNSKITEIHKDQQTDLAKQELEVLDALSKAERSLANFGELFAELMGVLDLMMSTIKMSMGNAVTAFATGNTGLGRSYSLGALKETNTTILMLTNLINTGEGEEGMMPGDLMQQLQKIASGELSLQLQMGTAESEQMMMQLSAEQQKLAEMLSELNRKISEHRLSEMLEKLTADMDDTARMMRRNEKRELIERKQIDIYRRLLDARRSRREKEDSEERKSLTANRNVSLGADKLADDLGEKKRDLNERINKAMKDDFNPEYLRLIRRYFESMLHDYEVVDRTNDFRAEP